MNKKMLLLVVGLICLVALIYFVVRVILPPLERSLNPMTGLPCLNEAIADTNANGIYDSGESPIYLPSLEVQVDDPDGPNSGRFSVGDCFFTPTEQARTVHLHFILPQGYVATTSVVDFDEHIIESAHFSDNVPQIMLYVRPG